MTAVPSYCSSHLSPLMPVLDTHLEGELFPARTFLRIAFVSNQFFSNWSCYTWLCRGLHGDHGMPII